MENSLFFRKEKPILKCDICKNEIEPIGINGQWCILQPRICEKCYLDIQREKEFELANDRKKNLKKIAISCGAPQKFVSVMRESDYNQDNIKELLEDIKQDKSLLIRGEPESGKTHLGIYLMLKMLKDSYSIHESNFKYTSLLTIDELIRKDWRESEILEGTKVKYLWFEFGEIKKERVSTDDKVSAWVDTLFFKIVNYRYNKKLPTIWMTRLDMIKAYNIYFALSSLEVP